MRCVSVIIPVYRDADRAIELVLALRSQWLPEETQMEVIVVDDGSGDGSAERIEQFVGGTIALRRLPVNAGRAVARNMGATAAKGEMLLFIDCDCLPATHHLIASHLRAWNEDVAASIGPVTGSGDGFWDRYQTDASRRRERQHAAGIFFSGSSQNLMVLRSAFVSCGGFDGAYSTYGFEDRELQLSIARYGRIAWADDASVRHMDILTLPLICRKMEEAGGSAATLFAQRHPEAYRALGYAALDARLHSWLKLPALLLDFLVEPAALWTDQLIANPHLPHELKSLLVKGFTAVSYLIGTTRDPHPT